MKNKHLSGYAMRADSHVIGCSSFFFEREIWIGKKRIEYTQLEKTSSVLIRFMIHPASVKLEGTRGSARNLLFRSMLEL